MEELRGRVNFFLMGPKEYIPTFLHLGGYLLQEGVITMGDKFKKLQNLPYYFFMALTDMQHLFQKVNNRVDLYSKIIYSKFEFAGERIAADRKRA